MQIDGMDIGIKIPASYDGQPGKVLPHISYYSNPIKLALLEYIALASSTVGNIQHGCLSLLKYPRQTTINLPSEHSKTAIYFSIVVNRPFL